MKHEFSIKLPPSLDEDRIFQESINPLIKPFGENIVGFWNYGFCEMMNNAIEHSNGTAVSVVVEQDENSTTITIHDNGEGIFKKLVREFGFYDTREAVLELSKGKLTTDESNHSGEGIFFTSRAFDEFSILSGGFFFCHCGDDKDWILSNKEESTGTSVQLKLSNTTTRTTKEVFDIYSSMDSGEYLFERTIVPIQLAQYENEGLVSRSQARRIMKRVDSFKIVILDFANIKMIGQAFADEIFRVQANKYPDIQINEVNAVKDVQDLVNRAKFRK